MDTTFQVSDPRVFMQSSSPRGPAAEKRRFPRAQAACEGSREEEVIVVRRRLCSSFALFSFALHHPKPLSLSLFSPSITIRNLNKQSMRDPGIEAEVEAGDEMAKMDGGSK